MSDIKFFKVQSLPSTLEPNALYFVENGQFCETYITNRYGSTRGIGNSAMINSIVTQVVAGLSKTKLEVVPTITARNGLTFTENSMVLVTDATGDTTVKSGAALYAYIKSSNSYTKVAEYESMDVNIAWESLSGKPVASPAQIDDAVSKAHQHSNKEILDRLSDDNGVLKYNGQPIKSSWETESW